MFKFISDTKNRYFMRLWWSQLISQFGDRINQMALIGLAHEKMGGSAMDLAKLLAFTIIPVFVVQPIAGVLVDRWSYRRTLLFCDLFRGALVLLIPLVFMKQDSMIPIYIVVFFIFCFSRFHVPAKMSIIPDLVPPDHLLTANSLITTTGMIAFVVGASLGGLIVEHLGASNGFLIDALTFIVSGSLIISIHKDFRLHLGKEDILKKGKEVLKAEKSFWKEMKEGVVYLWQNKNIRFVMGMLFILLAAAGSVYVVIIVFIQESFGSVTRDLGILAPCLGAGLFTGAVAYGKWGKNMTPYTAIFTCLTFGGVMMAVFAAIVAQTANLLISGVLAYGLGAILGPIFIACNTITHLVSSEEMRGKVFSSLEIVIHLAFLMAMLLSSWLAGFIPKVYILIAVGVIFTVTGIAGAMRYKKHPPLANQGQEML